MDLGIGAGIQTGLNFIAKTLNLVRDYGTNYYKDMSLAEAAKLTRVEPITIVSQDLVGDPVIKNVLNGTLSMFTGYYLQAVDIMTKVNDVEVIRVLDRLNPDRDETGFLMSEKTSRESYRVCTEEWLYRLPTKSKPALESQPYPTYNEPDHNDPKYQTADPKTSGYNNPRYKADYQSAKTKYQNDVKWYQQRYKEESDAKLATSKQEDKKYREDRDEVKDAKDMRKEVRDEEIYQEDKKYREDRDKVKDAKDMRKEVRDEEIYQEDKKYREDRDKVKDTQFQQTRGDRLTEVDYRKERDKAEYLEIGQKQNTKDVDLNDLVNLSVGRVVSVNIAFSKEKGKMKGQNMSVSLEVSIRLLVSCIPNDSITRIMSYRGQDLSLIERYHATRSGSIDFIRDFILCQDIIDEYKKAAIQDPDKILSEIARRNSNAKKYGLLTKNPSLVAASTIMVISDKVAADVEYKIGGKLSDARTREKVFENTYMMLLVVVDKQWETVTFYVRGLNKGSTMSYKEIESKSKGSGPDVGDIMKAISAGQPPSF